MYGKGRRQQLQGRSNGASLFRFSSSFSFYKRLRFILVLLALVALLPPVFFHFRLRRFHQMQLRRCGWLNNPPLVCAHGGDSTNALPNTMSAYNFALRSQVDCIEIDVSRSSDGVLFALHDRDLQRISGNSTSKVGDLRSNEVEKMQCKNCLIWAKSDSLARDIIKLSSDVMVGYIVMVDPSTGARTNLLRMKGARVVGVYHPLIDERLVKVLHGRGKKAYAWTVDDADSMMRMLHERADAIVTSNPSLLQRIMQDKRTQCLEEGFSLTR
ncbi:glycerophosphodiester phosphodiesterase GDPD4 isoform X3 [Durio zibethinus]|uniref:glycerophosphodiester phosphodiesterase n=1 Tax=Durio zibethinus TaxID=66656 RepID=A0A6P5WR47_DURZI|nr:glycerophosphodiester phosphodiesterase GDPD4 isoform X3 [Durio zibethinus]